MDVSRIPRTPADPLRGFERRRLIAWRESIDTHQRLQSDAAIARRLVGHVAARAPGVLALYWPIRGEPDLSPALQALEHQGWRFALPRIVGRDAPLEFGLWRPGQPMCAAGFGAMLPEPFDPVAPDVMVIPCVGFDRRGYRLGYGGGFYDRTLGARQRPTIGIAYDGSELTAFDAQPHDRPLDCVITETRVLGAGPSIQPRAAASSSRLGSA